ncbi:hypothetical protein K0M31_000964 [Melipona bicolor]|uniref:Uncharacterized protein n=1 Tax=Melipona bicolor TaxID=60889 RepID=A0AA40GEK5_9HYME|nr:hypothetical protein K0M31_000964 [Melipona bicolor]
MENNRKRTKKPGGKEKKRKEKMFKTFECLDDGSWSAAKSVDHLQMCAILRIKSCVVGVVSLFLHPSYPYTYYNTRDKFSLFSSPVHVNYRRCFMNIRMLCLRMKIFLLIQRERV